MWCFRFLNYDFSATVFYYLQNFITVNIKENKLIVFQNNLLELVLVNGLTEMKQHTDSNKCSSDFKLHNAGQEVLIKPSAEG